MKRRGIRAGTILAAASLPLLGLALPALAGPGTPEGCVLVQGTTRLVRVDPTNGGGIGGTSCTFQVRDHDHFFGSGTWVIRVFSDSALRYQTAEFTHDSLTPVVSTPSQDAEFVDGFYVTASLSRGVLSVGSGTGT